jgi:hypothetical protein
MPAAQKYPSPPEQLHELAAKAKAEGKSFDEFWDAAMPPLVKVPIKEKGQIVGYKTEDDGSWMERPARRLPRVADPDPPEDAVLWPGDTADRNNWYHAIVWGKESWRRVYEGLPALRGESAVSLLRTG